MNAKVDFQKPFAAFQNLMNIQMDAMTKSVEQQKKTNEALAEFFKTEAEKAKELKNPEELIKFNVSANQALFELMQKHGEEFTAIANTAREAAMTELGNMAK